MMLPMIIKIERKVKHGKRFRLWVPLFLLWLLMLWALLKIWFIPLALYLILSFAGKTALVKKWVLALWECLCSLQGSHFELHNRKRTLKFTIL